MTARPGEITRFKTKIPQAQTPPTSPSLMDETSMVLVLRELAKTHGIFIDLSQAMTLIKENKARLTTTLSFCRFFEVFVKENS